MDKDCKNCMNCAGVHGFMCTCNTEKHYTAEDGTPMVCYSVADVSRKKANKCDEYDEIVLSQSELQIYKGCIALMQEMVDSIEQWYKFIHGDEAINQLEEDEMFCVNITPFHIVQRLFLWNTNHCGGNSTRTKCRQIGIKDSFHDIEFSFEKDEEEE